VPEGTPLAGYGGFHRRLVVPDVLDRYPHAFWFKPGRAERDPLAARALVLERDGTRVVWVTVDLVAVDRAFTETVATRLARAGARPGALIVSASHTHSGPGAFVESALMGFVAADRGGRALGEAASALADAGRVAWERAPPVGAGRLVARVVRVDLPAPRLSLRNCLGGWMPAVLTVPLDGALPSETTLTAVALG